MDLAEVNAQLTLWWEALSKCSSGQAYVIGGVRNGRSLTRADLPEIRNTIDWLESKKAELESGNKINVRRVVL